MAKHGKTWQNMAGGCKVEKFSFDHGQRHKCTCWAAPSQLKIQLVGVQLPWRITPAFRFATNPKRYLNWCCTMSLGVSWFWPSLDFQVLRCDAMKIWCCTASSFSDVSPWPAKMLSPSSPPPGWSPAVLRASPGSMNTMSGAWMWSRKTIRSGCQAVKSDD